MTLFWSMLPVYLFGNFHCLGMCGPLVMLLSRHRYRYLYFFGRGLSFSLAAGLAGGAGTVLNVILQRYQIPAATSLLFGGLVLGLGLCHLLRWPYPGQKWLARRSSGLSQRLGLLMSRDEALPAFLFGFCTVLLPCGQSLLVFSACAMTADPWVGLANGAAFALLTSPSLLLASQAPNLLAHGRHWERLVIGGLALLIGSLALLRGLAELGMIGHVTVYGPWHIVLY